ncbi:MAG: hypothetical protein C0610_02000 [Desulfobacteraceae bacterium]|nr:MAG: hypothetical protein C0610_02000 [Desulfobacteraceae bacterium]
MDYFFLLGYIIIISTGWQHMRRRRAQSAKRIAFLGLRFFAMSYALCAMRSGINLENASASAIPVACRSEAEIPLQRGCGVSERTTIEWINSLHFEDSLQLAAGSFNFGLHVTGFFATIPSCIASRS